MSDRPGTPICPSCVEDLHDLLGSTVPWVMCETHEDEIAAIRSRHWDDVSDALTAFTRKLLAPPTVLEGEFTALPPREVSGG